MIKNITREWLFNGDSEENKKIVGMTILKIIFISLYNQFLKREIKKY